MMREVVGDGNRVEMGGYVRIEVVAALEKEEEERKRKDLGEERRWLPGQVGVRTQVTYPRRSEDNVIADHTTVSELTSILLKRAP